MGTREKSTERSEGRKKRTKTTRKKRNDGTVRKTESVKFKQRQVRRMQERKIMLSGCVVVVDDLI
jgi:hypothetical protein